MSSTTDHDNKETSMRARIILASALLAASALCPSFAQTQQNPNSEQILKSLTPAPGMSEKTRGIRIGTPQGGPPTQATSASQAVQAPQASATTNPASVNLNVEFASGSANLTPSAMRTLDELGRALANPSLSAYRFRIEGHTDTVGSADLNQTLSERRAATVVGYLASKYSINPDRLQPVGMGVQGLLVATPDQTAEPRNRRVLVVNVGS